MRHDVSLADRFDLTKSSVLLNGTQALVRLMLVQKERDRRAGLHTGGYVSGYRGSPLGAVDQQMAREDKLLRANDILFRPGLNEDLAATAIWGTQQAELAALMQAYLGPTLSPHRQDFTALIGQAGEQVQGIYEADYRDFNRETYARGRETFDATYAAFKSLLIGTWRRDALAAQTAAE